MKKENIILRILGLLLLIGGVYWFWKISAFTIIAIWGIPLPLQIILIVIGFFTFVSPGPFLKILAVFLPKEKSEQFIDFIDTHLNTKNAEPLVFRAEDKGEVLADKLNRATFLSKRRFYIGAVIALIIFPIINLYFIKIEADKKSNLLRESDSIVKVVQKNRLTFQSADKYREVLSLTADTKSLSPDKSSTAKIHKILSQLYDEKVTNQGAFETALGSIYTTEIEEILKSSDFDFKRITVPTSETDSEEARSALYILLAMICNIRGENGRFMEPYLFGRGILNQIELKPSVFYHVSGWNYGGLLKSTLVHKFETFSRLANTVFFNIYPSKLVLATKARAEYQKYKESENSQLAIVRYENNFVDIYLPIILSLRINKEVFNANTKEEAEIIFTLNTPDLTEFFKDLHEHLDRTKGYISDPVIFTTKAQLYSLEGEVNTKERTLDKGLNPVWCEQQRKNALNMIRFAYSDGTKDTLSYENRETSYLMWLWNDPASKEELMKLGK